MATLARRVGLGLAARGDVKDTVAWAGRARAAGLESVWFHDSYFERDAVTYATAVAAQVEAIKIGLGALNPFTRHPVLIAMTISALDEIAPERILLGLGSALPLRLGQMGIPYTPDDAVTRSSEAIDTLHTLWKGERMPPGKPGLPPLQPMFPPVHRVPIYIAGYRSPVMVLAGQKGDGYLARPAESIPGLKKLLGVMNKAAREAGAVRHLHDEHPLRCHPRARWLRVRAARPHRGGVAQGGLHDRRRAHPGRSAGRVHPVRHASRSCWESLRISRGRDGPAAPAAGRAGRGSGLGGAGRGDRLRDRRSGHRRDTRGARRPAEGRGGQ